MEIASVVGAATDAQLEAALEEGISGVTTSMFMSLVQDAQKQEEERQARLKEMNQGIA